MNARQTRLAELLDLLRFESGATIRDLAIRLGVSQMTVRRDLAVLEQQRLVKMMHGGAVYCGGTAAMTEIARNLTSSELRLSEEKRLIGQAAASLIQKDDVVIIDTGTTTEYIARQLPIGYHYTVICYNLNILLEVTKLRDVEVVFAGGYYHGNTTMFVSAEGIQLIRSNRAGIAFMSAAGVSIELGVTCANAYETETKRAAIGSSLRKVLVVDSSKFGRVRPYHFADIGDFDTIITDGGIDDRHRREIRRLGIEIVEV